MALTLYYHPFSSYCQKVLIALYENGTPFTPRLINLADAADEAALRAVWPIRLFPVLEDEKRREVVPEATIIIEYLALHYPGPFQPLPADQAAALDVRLWDRIFDNYVMTPMQKLGLDLRRPADAKDPAGVKDARDMLHKAYALINDRMADRTWAAGDGFSLADCAAAPALFYANLLEPFADYPHVQAYFDRLQARPSFARCVEEAKPYRAFFPKPFPKE
jgi:glutathione S-transferase